MKTASIPYTELAVLRSSLLDGSGRQDCGRGRGCVAQTPLMDEMVEAVAAFGASPGV